MISVSALALSGSMAFAMEEDAMDEAMMMEAPAPSVTLTGEGELGFKNVDQDTMPNAETIHLIRKYKVGFASSSTTDGGLVFGAGISIIDEQGKPGDTKAVGGSNAYIGAADGTWKLKLGGNDPGIDVAGIIGVASEDGFFDGGDNAQIGLEGAFGGTTYRITLADPQLAKGTQGDGDWSAGARIALGEYAVGVGMDSEGGVALGLGATLSGVGLEAVYSKADESAFDLKNAHTSMYAIPSSNALRPTVLTSIAAGNSTANFVRKSHGQRILEANRNRVANANTGVTAITGRTFASTARIQSLGSNYGSAEWKGLGFKATMPAGEGVKFSAAYSQKKGETGMGAGNYRVVNAPTAATGVPGATEISDFTAVPAAGKATAMTNAQNAVVTGTEEVKKIELGMEYDLGGGATLKAAVKKEDHETTAALASTHATNGIVDPTAAVAADNPRSVPYMNTDSITTLELKIAFSF